MAATAAVPVVCVAAESPRLRVRDRAEWRAARPAAAARAFPCSHTVICMQSRGHLHAVTRSFACSHTVICMQSHGHLRASTPQSDLGSVRARNGTHGRLRLSCCCSTWVIGFGDHALNSRMSILEVRSRIAFKRKRSFWIEINRASWFYSEN